MHEDQPTPHLPHLHETCFTTHMHFFVLFPLVQQLAFLCLLQTCFVGKSFSEHSWDSCLVRVTLVFSWNCGYYCFWYGLSRWLSRKLRVVVSSSCKAGRFSALVAECGFLQLFRARERAPPLRPREGGRDGLERTLQTERPGGVRK